MHCGCHRRKLQTTVFTARVVRNTDWLNDTGNEDMAQQNHWSERGRATSVANADALGRPRRSVLALSGELDCTKTAPSVSIEYEH